MRIILLGAPGAGKGTAASKLVSRNPVLHLSTGDMLRSAIKNETEIGKLAKTFMDRGNLVPDDVVMGIMEERLAQQDCASGFILDGFPRTIAQAEALDRLLDKLQLKLDGVINLDVPEKELISRLTSRRTCSNSSCNAIYNLIFKAPQKEGICDLCGSSLYQRDDETEEVIRQRLVIYKEKTAPLIGYYSGRDTYLSISDTDLEKIVSAIEKKAS